MKKGFIIFFNLEKDKELVESYRLKHIRTQGIALHLEGKSEDFSKFEAENPRYIVCGGNTSVSSVTA